MMCIPATDRPEMQPDPSTTYRAVAAYYASAASRVCR